MMATAASDDPYVVSGLDKIMQTLGRNEIEAFATTLRLQLEAFDGKEKRGSQRPVYPYGRSTLE